MERISTQQFMILSTMVLMGTVFFPIGVITVTAAGRDGWLAVLPGFIAGIPFGFMLISLLPKYPNKNLLEITELLLGKVIGKALGIIYIAISTYMGGLLVGQGVDVFMRTILPLTPTHILTLACFILVFYVYISGLEVLARFAEVIFPIIAMALILIAIFSYPRFEHGELYPILADGIRPVIMASFNVVPFSMEYILFLAGLLPFLPRKKKDLKQLRKGIRRAVLLVSFLLTIVVVIQILTFGPFETVRVSNGLLALSKMIEISNTIAGVESIFLLIWLGAMVIKVSVFFFTSIWGIQSVFKIKKKWITLFIASIFIYIPLNISRRSIEIINEAMFVDRYLIMPFAIFWVLLIWGWDKWKSRAKR